jgi:hypothetical protein
MLHTNTIVAGLTVIFEARLPGVDASRAASIPLISLARRILLVIPLSFNMLPHSYLPCKNAGEIKEEATSCGVLGWGSIRHPGRFSTPC